MRSYFLALSAISLLSVIVAETRNHKKRQIYREQVLPHAGGKIPDTAFETERLFLNRLQKEGIAIPDGIVPEQRNPQVHPFHHKSTRTVYRIALSSDARFTPKEGQHHYEEPPSIETTYLYPQIHGHQLSFKPSTPAYPVYRQFQLHNPKLNQVKLQPKKKAPHLLDITPNYGKNQGHSLKPESYQNLHVLNLPLSTSGSTDKFYLPNYGSSHLLNEFDEIFNSFNLHETGASFYGKPNKNPSDINY